MLGLFGDIEDYNNAGALIGLDATDNNELLGALRKMNPIKRQRMINKLSSSGMPSRGSRAEMEKHFAELPPYIKDGLAKGDLRLADTVIYSIKPVNSKTIKMFETQDDKQIGLRNISNAKLPKNQALLVSGIFLLGGIAVDDTPDNVMAITFSAIESWGALASGETDLKANKKQIFPETSNAVFKTINYQNTPLGYYKLANPRLILDDILIELTVQLGTMTGLPAHTYLYAGLHGTITTP